MDHLHRLEPPAPQLPSDIMQADRKPVCAQMGPDRLQILQTYRQNEQNRKLVFIEKSANQCPPQNRLDQVAENKQNYQVEF